MLPEFCVKLRLDFDAMEYQPRSWTKGSPGKSTEAKASKLLNQQVGGQTGLIGGLIDIGISGLSRGLFGYTSSQFQSTLN